MYKFNQIFKRDFLNLALNPAWILYVTLFPYLLVLILGFLGSGSYTGSVTSYDYYGIAMMIYIIFNTSTIAANSFMEERIKNGNMRLIYSPIPKSYIYVSKIAATFVFTGICHVLVLLLLKLTLNVNLGGKNIGFVILILIVFELFSSILGVLLCCIFRSENTTNQILSIIVNIFSILGGLFFRVDGLGKNIEKISSISPVKWIITDIFKIIYSNDFSGYVQTILIISVISVLAVILCGKFYRTEDYV
ncbi:ABC transporter permease [Clostridium oryzae]|uniref:Transport permease protein n=1 Tax=Clostridium oryzae TaxID=1450648 RepID=A0A1V4ITD8_9CLOT|nr:ABC transporter permease [Clostridium oryzae]OPJ63065.1 ABC-2 type transporter [Clostridium oryzae]